MADNEKLLTRDEFRERVFCRDRKRCIVPRCTYDAVDAHHIIERKLWNDPSEKEGYFIHNGASVCEMHHRLAEKNVILPCVFRHWLVLPKKEPKHFIETIDYNKWGISVKMPNRVQIKYPSTPYIDNSPNIDCSLIKYCEDFEGQEVVVTLKMDGSNVLLTNNRVAARNGLTADHESFDALKAIHAGLQSYISPNLQIFGEWLYAKHSIHYIGDLELKSFLQVFAIYDLMKRIWLSWDEVNTIAAGLGLHTVKLVYSGEVTRGGEFRKELKELGDSWIDEGHEGLVIRSALPFHYSQFEQCMAKYVREDHVQTDQHWSSQKVVRNHMETE